MITGGVDVDIETGLPRAAVASKHNHTEAVIAQSNLAETQAQETLVALHSPEGQIFIKEAMSVLERRIDAFIQQDQGCQSIIQMLRGMNYKINVAPEKARMLVERFLGFKAAP